MAANDQQAHIIARLAALIEQRKLESPDSSYVARLHHQGRAKIAQKVGEEGVETALAGVGEDSDKLVLETADLWFHSLVLLSAANRRPEEVFAELERRFGLSGLDEKASRAQD
ncbi:MAG TPA: phosphoribosyl-ATP diphosphatase [Halothiobacillaceae bacterium]|nr:phosphoribosyl-ATP diphosphatase [Halothiobacillaceae bacterium]